MILALASACSGASPSGKSPRNTLNSAPSVVSPKPADSATTSAVSSAAPPVPEVVQGRTILGFLVPTNLPTSVEPLPADRAALLVSHGADERESFVRWIDEQGQMGPVWSLRDEYVVTAFTRADAKRDVVTSDGEQLCLTRHAPDRAESEARKCATIEAKAVAVADRKLAVIALEEHKTTVEKTVVIPAVRRPKPAAPKTTDSKKPTQKATPKKKPSTTKKKPAPAKKKKDDKKPRIEKRVEVIRRDIEVLASWATSDGFGEFKRTGLKFSPPMDGMTIVDARATKQGILVGWFEKAKPPPDAPKTPAKGTPALGFGAILAGIIDPNGVFDEKSKKVVIQAEYDWGFLRGFSGPRFVDVLGGVGLLTHKNVRGGPFEITKVGESATSIMPLAMSSVDPSAWPSVDTKPMATIMEAGPKRRPGQPKHDAELVAWAGDTGYFVTNEGRKLQSTRRDGSIKEAPPPFPARRSRLTRAEIHADGHGFAVVDGQTFNVDAAGDVAIDATPAKPIFTSVGFDGRWNEALALVRPGYRVIPRATDGVIIVGISTSKEENVVAVTVDGRGNLGVAAATSLRVVPGEFDLHVSARPGGGGWVADPRRKRVIWLDDEVHEVAAANWPEGEANAVCRDGLPGKKFVPSVIPGQFVEVPALAAPGICVFGNPSWAKDGTLRWFGTYTQGLDVIAELRILRDLERPWPISGASESGIPAATNKGKAPCPPEMVLVDGRLCVDRFEATIIDPETGQTLAPDFPVTPNLFDIAIGDWATGRSRVGSVFARSMPLPFVPEWQRGKKIDVQAVPLPHVRPNGYLTGLIAESACTAAGKRLCNLNEFVMACRGEDDTQFPYGDTYVDGLCNVNRDAHPAAFLHDNASIGHLDPRLNRVRVGGSTLLQETASSPQCRSRWGSDAIYDMVGNLDEWVDEGSGAFAGGFYARSTRSGCEAVITAHPKNYLDYSTGVRCCKDASK